MTTTCRSSSKPISCVSPAADAKQYEADAARAALAAAQANQDVARRDRDRLQAEQAAAAKLRANLRLRSPVAGQSVLRLIDPAGLWLRVRIDQGRSAGLRAGLSADIVLRSHPDMHWPGQVARVELVGDSVTEEKIAQVAFERLPEGVALGELAEVTVRLPSIPAAVTLPNAALHRNTEQEEGVWRLTEEGKTQFQPVRIGVRTLEGQMQVLTDLPPEAQIIVHSERELRAGDKVKPVAALAGRGR